MPHRHRRTITTTDVIEDTIDRLLRQGEKISDALEKEVKYAEKKYAEEPKRNCLSPSRGSSVTRSAVTVTPSKNTSSARSTSRAGSTANPRRSDVSAIKSSGRSTNSSTSGSSNAKRPARSRTSTKNVSTGTSESRSYDLSDAPSLATEVSYSSYATFSHRSVRSNGRMPVTFHMTQKEDITSDMLDPPSSSVATAIDNNNPFNDAMPKKEDTFLGLQTYPCFIRDGDIVVERKARCTFHRRAESNWIVLRYDVDDIDGRKLVVLRCELLGRLVRNVFINGVRA